MKSEEDLVDSPSSSAENEVSVENRVEEEISDDSTAQESESDDDSSELSGDHSYDAETDEESHASSLPLLNHEELQQLLFVILEASQLVLHSLRTTSSVSEFIQELQSKLARILSAQSAVLPVPLSEEFADLAAGREDNDCDDDEVVQAILRAREKHRNHPPAIECEDGVASLSFHPTDNMIAVGTFTGDVLVYTYSDDACELKDTHELHTKAIRDVEFSKDGKSVLSSSKDKSILMTDVASGKLSQLWDKAHLSPVQTLYLLDDNRFCSGCEDGFVKLWDKRQRDCTFSVRVMEDVVNAMVSTPQLRHLAVACGGTITSINLNARKLQVQSEEYDHDFTCLSLFRNDTKLMAGSSKGTFYTFNWGEFGLHCDEFTAFKQPVSCMLSVTETVAVVGWEDGKIRATHLFPHQPLGVVGQHEFSVECMDICNDGSIIASAAAAGGHVKFWNIKYIEEVEVTCTKRKKRQDEHNLPSSSMQNRSDFFSDLGRHS